MNLMKMLLSNLMALPILFFLSGVVFSFFRLNWLFRPAIHSFITYVLLFSIGLKGGMYFIQYSDRKIFSVMGVLVLWCLIQPFISYALLRKFSRVDSATAAAIAACFGSVSVMTFATGTAFLEKLDVPFQPQTVAFLAVMEVPAILSGLFISKWMSCSEGKPTKNLWIETLLNKTILMLLLGMIVGVVCHQIKFDILPSYFLISFKPLLCLFLFYMGLLIEKQRKDLSGFSWPLSLFGFYTPLLGGIFGIFVSYLFGLDVGTGTLIAILSASASYIAVPAAMKIALPEAKEGVYLPLSLGIAFPFNVLIGIPIYYVLASKLL